MLQDTNFRQGRFEVSSAEECANRTDFAQLVEGDRPACQRFTGHLQAIPDFAVLLAEASKIGFRVLGLGTGAGRVTEEQCLSAIEGIQRLEESPLFFPIALDLVSTFGDGASNGFEGLFLIGDCQRSEDRTQEQQAGPAQASPHAFRPWNTASKAPTQPTAAPNATRLALA